MLGKRPMFSCFVGLFIGMVFSPVMWLVAYNPPTPFCAPQHTKESPPSPVVAPPALVQLQPPVKDTRDIDIEKRNEIAEPVRYHSVTPKGDPKVRHAKLSDELASRKLLFVGVVTAQKYLDTRAVAINNTWGRGLSDIHYFASSSAESKHLPIITLPGINDTVYPPQRKVYHMLKYMHDHYIDQYDFFMRSDDDVYVRTDLLDKLLLQTNPAQDLYMGCPGFGKTADRARLKLEKNEHYCMGGPGVIFSRSALRKLAPHLDKCLEEVVVSYNEDVEVGRCVSKRLHLQCTWSWEAAELFWADYNHILDTPKLYTNPYVEKAITLHPVKDPRLMYRVHQYLQELKLRRWMQKVSDLQEDIQRISHLVPADKRHFQLNRWLWYSISTNPLSPSRHKLGVWEYFNSSHLFLNQEQMPVTSITDTVNRGINMALAVLVTSMNKHQGSSSQFVSPYSLLDGYMLTDHSSGVQYKLHLSLHKTGTKHSLEYLADVFLPFHGAGMTHYAAVESLSKRTVHLIINVGKTADLTNFVYMYEKVCIDKALPTHLHVVMFGVEGEARVQLAELVSRHPTEPISSYELMEGVFSHTGGYQHVASKLQPDDLMVLMDYHFSFTSQFIWHVQMNTVMQQQVYFPILFSYYKTDLVRKYVAKSHLSTISADTGFFLRYNYQVVGIFKCDYDTVSLRPSEAPSGKNDDVKFLDKALSSDIYVMRALEPSLRRPYLKRSCDRLSGTSHTSCMNSKADAIGSKKMLGNLLISHDLLDTV